MWQCSVQGIVRETGYNFAKNNIVAIALTIADKSRELLINVTERSNIKIQKQNLLTRCAGPLLSTVRAQWKYSYYKLVFSA